MASLGTENVHCPGTPPRQRPQEITQAAQITGNPLSFPPWPPALDAHPEKLYSSKAQRARSSGDRVLASEAKGRTFDSCRARHFPFLVGPSCPHPPLPSVPSPLPAGCRCPGFGLRHRTLLHCRHPAGLAAHAAGRRHAGGRPPRRLTSALQAPPTGPLPEPAGHARTACREARPRSDRRST